MRLSNVFERLGSAIFESPFGANRLAKDAPELAEIRLAVLEAAKAKSHRVGGKMVFPYDSICVCLLGIEDQQASVLQGEFVKKYLEEEVTSGLARSSYRFPQNVVIEIETTPRMPAEGESWFSIETKIRKPETPHEQPSQPAFVTVLKGVARPEKLTLSKPRTNIGRGVEVLGAGGPSRRNDLAFIGEGTVESSVSREHAHIVRQAKTGEYRLVNDRLYKGDANCGLWIVREGESLPVHRSSRGTLLVSGDELYFGLAVIRFSTSDVAPEVARESES